MLVHLPNGHTAADVNAAMAAKITHLPAHLARSITWDQGSELARHRQFSIDTGIDVYFCDPHCTLATRQQREHQRTTPPVLPQRHRPRLHDAAHLDAVADQLNGRPRKTLNWQTPAEALATFLDAIAA